MRTGTKAILWLAALGLPALGATSGCDSKARQPVQTIATVPEVRRVEVSVVAAPVFRLVIPPASADAPSRLIAVHVQLRSKHPNAVIVRPDWIRLLLPDGSLRFAFDPPRATELVRRTALARADLSYVGDGVRHVPGGLDERQRRHFTDLLIEQLLSNTRLEPGGRAEGYVIIDTGRPFTDLAGSPLELITTDDAAPPRGSESVPLLTRLSLPCEPPL